MGLRFQSQLQIQNLPDEQLSSAFEVIMPKLPLNVAPVDSANNAIIQGIFNTSLFGYQPIVEEIIFGFRKFKTETRRVRTSWINVPSDTENIEKVKITMFCSSGMLTQRYLNMWRSMVYNAAGEYYNSMNYYKKNITVLFYGPASLPTALPIAKYTLVGCFPADESVLSLKYTQTPERLRLTQTFSVDMITEDDPDKYVQAAVFTESLTSPQAALTDALIGSSAPDKYSTSNAYSV